VSKWLNAFGSFISTESSLGSFYTMFSGNWVSPEIGVLSLIFSPKIWTYKTFYHGWSQVFSAVDQLVSAAAAETRY